MVSENQKKQKYKIDKKLFSIAIITSLLISSCNAQPKKDYKLSIREKNYSSFMYDPLDWTYDPDTVFIEIKGDSSLKIEMSLEEFKNLINTNKEYIIIKGNEKSINIKTKELKEYSERLLSNITSQEVIYPAKILFIFSESVLILSFGLATCAVKDICKQKYKKK